MCLCLYLIWVALSKGHKATSFCCYCYKVQTLLFFPSYCVMMRVLGFINNSFNGLQKHKGIAKIKFKANPLGFNQFRSRGLSDSKFFNGNDTVLPVLIVGAGPVGLVLSILLTKLGMPLWPIMFFFMSFLLVTCLVAQKVWEVKTKSGFLLLFNALLVLNFTFCFL